MTTDTNGLQVLDRNECERLLAEGLYGRIVYTRDALPAVQPVNYILYRDALIVRTASAAKLAAAGRNEVVAFEVDDIDPLTGSGWSVVVTGRVREVRDPEEFEQVSQLAFPDWVLQGPGRYLAICCELVSGRRLNPPAREASVHGIHCRAS